MFKSSSILTLIRIAYTVHLAILKLSEWYVWSLVSVRGDKNCTVLQPTGTQLTTIMEPVINHDSHKTGKSRIICLSGIVNPTLNSLEGITTLEMII